MRQVHPRAPAGRRRRDRRGGTTRRGRRHDGSAMTTSCSLQAPSKSLQAKSLIRVAFTALAAPSLTKSLLTVAATLAATLTATLQPPHTLTVTAVQARPSPHMPSHLLQPRSLGLQMSSCPRCRQLQLSHCTLTPAEVPRRHSGSDECAGSRCITAASQVHQTGRRKCAGPGAGPVMWGRRDDNVAALVRGGRGGGRGARCTIRRGATVTSPPALPHGPHRSLTRTLLIENNGKKGRGDDDPTTTRRRRDGATRRRRRRLGPSQSLQPPAPSQSLQVQVP